LPRFELEPKDVAVRVGDTARFNCLVMVYLTNYFPFSKVINPRPFLIAFFIICLFI
jgi:hypothetical protein